MDKLFPTIEEFDGEYSFLSNFYPCTFKWHNMIWSTSEHAYQAAKSLSKPDWLRINALPTPGLAKAEGRKLVMRSDWDSIKLDVMREIVTAKFVQNPDLKQKLKDTKEFDLEEGNHWGDRYWGISPAGSGDGQNHLGKILMELRDGL